MYESILQKINKFINTNSIIYKYEIDKNNKDKINLSTINNNYVLNILNKLNIKYTYNISSTDVVKSSKDDMTITLEINNIIDLIKNINGYGKYIEIYNSFNKNYEYKNNSIILCNNIDFDYISNQKFDNIVYIYKYKDELDIKNFLDYQKVLKYITNKELKKSLFILFEKVINILNEIKITWWLECGTLLGAVRHKDMIPWDDDFDLGILLSDEDLLIKNKHLFDKQNLRLQKNGSSQVYWQVDNLYGIKGPIHPSIHMDIFLYSKENNLYKNTDIRYSNPDIKSGHCNIVYEFNDLFPLSKLQFNKYLLPVANNWDKVLKNAIGNKYMNNAIIKNNNIKVLEINLDNHFMKSL